MLNFQYLESNKNITGNIFSLLSLLPEKTRNMLKSWKSWELYYLFIVPWKDQKNIEIVEIIMSWKDPENIKIMKIMEIIFVPQSSSLKPQSVRVQQTAKATK